MNTATTPTRRSVILPAAERERIWFFGGTVGVLATGADTDDRHAIVEQHLPAGTATPLHAHLNDEESFVVLTGEVVYQVGDDAPAGVGVGGFIHVPAGVPHAFRVTDAGDVRLLNITTPGHERFIRAAGDPAGADGFPPPDRPTCRGYSPPRRSTARRSSARRPSSAEHGKARTPRTSGRGGACVPSARNTAVPRAVRAPRRESTGAPIRARSTRSVPEVENPRAEVRRDVRLGDRHRNGHRGERRGEPHRRHRVDGPG